jgi:formylmethanofuran dehydrogenase subunit E
VTVRDSCSSRTHVAGLPAAQAVGRRALHDMTRVVPGESKDPAFLAGQLLTAGDVCRLHTMGRERVFVLEDVAPDLEWIHENEAAVAFARAMAGDGVSFEEPPREGKINFRAEKEGLLLLDRPMLRAFNLVEGVMCASRQGFLPVEGGKRFAACRAIPLYLARNAFDRAMAILEDGPLFRIAPIEPLPTGILVTGTEVFKGLIQDRFIPIVKSKVEKFGCSVSGTAVVPTTWRPSPGPPPTWWPTGQAPGDHGRALRGPGRRDPARPKLAGLTDALYGAPILPGHDPGGAMARPGSLAFGLRPVLSDHGPGLLLPRLLAGVDMTGRIWPRWPRAGIA